MIIIIINDDDDKMSLPHFYTLSHVMNSLWLMQLFLTRELVNRSMLLTDYAGISWYITAHNFGLVLFTWQQRDLVGTRSATSHPGCLDKHHSHLVARGLISGREGCLLSRRLPTKNADYCMVINEWAQLRSQVCIILAASSQQYSDAKKSLLKITLKIQ